MNLRQIAINCRKSAKEAEETEEMAMPKACEQVEESAIKSLLIQGDVSKNEANRRVQASQRR